MVGVTPRRGTAILRINSYPSFSHGLVLLLVGRDMATSGCLVGVGNFVLVAQTNFQFTSGSHLALIPYPKLKSMRYWRLLAIPKRSASCC